MTNIKNTDTAKAFRAARNYYRESGAGQGWTRRAGAALELARNRLAQVDAARVAYEIANPVTADAGARGALPIDGAGGHAKRSAYVDARARAGLYHGDSAWRVYPDTDSAFRDTVAAHDVTGAGIDHNGWYDNPHGESSRDGSGLCFGVVCQLPGKGGLSRYVAGYQFGDCEGGPTLDLGTIYESRVDSSWDTPDAKIDAARAGDSMAEKAAETEQAYQAAWGAGSLWADLGEQVKTTRAATLELLKQNRESGGSRDLPAIHATIRDSVCRAWENMQEARQERAALASGGQEPYWFYWSERDDSQLQGFAEGAGLTMLEARAVCS